MLSDFKEFFPHDAYRVLASGQVELLNDPLFSRDVIHEKLIQNDVVFFEVFLETGYEKKAVMLNRKKLRLTEELKALELHIKSVSLLINKFEKELIKKKAVCSKNTQEKIKKYINEAKEKHQNDLEDEIQSGEAFFHGHFVTPEGDLESSFKRIRQACFDEVLDILQPTGNETVIAMEQRTRGVLAEVSEKKTLLTQMKTNVDHRLAVLQTRFEEVMKARRAKAQILLENKNYAPYHDTLQKFAQEEGSSYMNIPVMLILNEQGDSLLHAAVMREGNYSALVNFLVARGADPLFENKETVTTLQSVADAYAKSGCDESAHTSTYFETLLCAFGEKNSVLLLNYDALDHLDDISGLDPLYQEVANCLHYKIRDMIDCQDIELSGLSKKVHAVEKNVSSRVAKFIMIYRGFLEALEHLKVEPLFMAIDRVNHQDSKNSDSTLTKGHDLHLESHWIKKLIALKKDYHADPSKETSKILGLGPLSMISHDSKHAMHKRENLALSCSLFAQEQKYKKIIADKDASIAQERFKYKKTIEEKERVAQETIAVLKQKIEEKNADIQDLQIEVANVLAGNKKLASMTRRLIKRNKELEATMKAIEAEYESGDSDHDEEKDGVEQKAGNERPARPNP